MGKHKVNDPCSCGSGKKYKKCCQIELFSKQNLTNKLYEYQEKSKELYTICHDEGCDNLPDPTNWIFNQDKMREMWENYKARCDECDHIMLKNMMLNNSFSKYMEFMYDTYPCGFGNEFKHCYDNEVEFDGTETFSKLIK